MSSKKRGSGRRKAHRQGLSGNPQRRAEQLGRDRQAGGDRDLSVLRELAYRFAGGALPEPWWRGSHERILARARSLTWPARLVDLETQACQIIGDEFHDRLCSRVTGLHPLQWLRALAEQTGAATRAALTTGADDWQHLWALLCGLALAAPQTPSDVAAESVSGKFPEFPDIEYPRETALAEAEKVAALVADGLEPGLGHLADGWRLVSRF